MNPTRVLIVDDVAQVRRDLSTALALNDAIVIIGQAANGLEAVQLAGSLQPDVILMDLEMPVMDGYKATRQIKFRWPACRVIALTVHDYESARQKAAQAGVDGYIVKGVSLESLVKTILGKKEKNSCASWKF